MRRVTRRNPIFPIGSPSGLFVEPGTSGPARGATCSYERPGPTTSHFHDSDDLFHPNWSFQVRKQLADGTVDAVFTEVDFFGADRTVTNERVLGLASLEHGKELTRFCVNGSLLTPSGTYKRSVISRIGGYRENLWQSEDFDFHVRLAASGIVYRLIDEPLVLCRSHASNRSRDHREVGTCGVQAIELLARELPIQYRPDLADRAAAIGASLFRLGAREEARAAFNLALEIGPPQLIGQRKSYRALGRVFGLEFAERTGALYRRVFPESMRRTLGH